MPDSAEPVAAAIAQTVATLPGIVSAYLFGSVATKRAHRQSDVDVAVLLNWAVYPDRPARFDVRVRLIPTLGLALRRDDVDLLILNDTPPHLAREVVTRGQRVYLADREMDHAFRRTAMLRAADLEPFLRRMRRVRLQALLSRAQQDQSDPRSG